MNQDDAKLWRAYKKDFWFKHLRFYRKLVPIFPREASLLYYVGFLFPGIIASLAFLGTRRLQNTGPSVLLAVLVIILCTLPFIAYYDKKERRKLNYSFSGFVLGVRKFGLLLPLPIQFLWVGWLRLHRQWFRRRYIDKTRQRLGK